MESIRPDDASTVDRQLCIQEYPQSPVELCRLFDAGHVRRIGDHDQDRIRQMSVNLKTAVTGVSSFSVQ